MEALKQFALAHFEKAILVLCALVLAWFLAGALRTKTYDKTPEQFAEATSKAEQNVLRGNPEVSDLTAPNFDVEAAKYMAAIGSSQPFQYSQQWLRPFDLSSSFRGQPKMLKPTKIWVQDNRGLMESYKFDAKGEPVVVERKRGEVKGKRKSVVGGAGGGVAAGGRGGGKMQDMYQKMMKKGMSKGGSSGGPGYGSGSGDYSGYGSSSMGGSSGMGMMMGSGMMGGNEYMDGGGSGMEGSSGMGMGGGMGENLGGPGKFSQKTDRTRFVRKDKVEKDAEKDAKDDEVVKTYVEQQRGERWVEIVAAYPHQDQIREFAKALKEGARTTKLRYAMAEVERREQLADLTWTAWAPIDIERQFFIVQNALAYEPEKSPIVLPGLAMNVPEMIVAQNPYLHETLPEFDPTKQEKANYLPEDLDPFFAERMKEELKRIRVRNPNAPKEDPEKTKEEVRQFLAANQGGGKLLGMVDSKKEAKGQLYNHHEIKTAMVRFWDFTVEPGRRYQYRIRATAFNPNYQRADVADPSFAAEPVLKGEWSEPSQEIFVLPDTQWYVGDNEKLAASERRGDRVNVEVHHWYKSMGKWVVNSFEQRPGDVIGLAQKAKAVPILRWNEESRTWEPKDQVLTEEFDTNNILLAVAGGKSKEPEYFEGRPLYPKAPREAVGITPFGELVRHQESYDKVSPERKLVEDEFHKLEDEIAEMRSGSKSGEPEDDPSKIGKKGGRSGRGDR